MISDNLVIGLIKNAHVFKDIDTESNGFGYICFAMACKRMRTTIANMELSRSSCD